MNSDARAVPAGMTDEQANHVAAVALAAQRIPIYEEPTNEKNQRIIAFKRLARELHMAISALDGDPRCKALALTELESSATWAVKAVHFK